MDVDDQDQGRDDGDGVRPGAAEPDILQQRGNRTGDRRFGDHAQARRAHGDAELGGGEHARDVFEGPQGGGGASVAGSGERLELGAA